MGKALRVGDDISTDHIIPGRFANLRSNLPELAKHALEDTYPAFAQKARPGDFLPRLVGHAALAASVAAYEQWLATPDSDLAELLATGYAELSRGFAGHEAAPLNRPALRRSGHRDGVRN